MSLSRILRPAKAFKMTVQSGQLIVQDGDSPTNRTYTLGSLEAVNVWTGVNSFNAAFNITGLVSLTGGFNQTSGSFSTTGDMQVLGAINHDGSTAGFYGTAPVSKHSSTGNVVGFSAESGTASKSDSTWDGDTGSTSYTVGDIVTCLKQLGLMTI